jgi:hypothetical protein
MGIIGHRHDFGKDWAEVVNDWCSGIPLPVPSDKAWEALGVLELHWPERLGEVLTGGRKGTFVMAHLIDDGLTLTACQNLNGFEGVLSRIKKGEQAALSEMRFAAALVELGYQPVLDTEHHGKRPDALIIADNKEIFIDAVTPGMSEDAKQAGVTASTLAQKLLEKLVNQTTPSRLEVYILTANLHHLADEITQFLDTPELSLSDTVYTIPNTALVKYSEQDAYHNVGATILVDTEFPVIGVARANVIGSIVNSVTVRLPFTDDRLELLMGRKRKQFSEDEVNLLVIDVAGALHGFKKWVPLAQRRLQPNLNRRFSGIVLYNRHLDISTGAFIRACHIEEHPSPYHKLPTCLLNDLSKFHQVPLTDNN